MTSAEVREQILDSLSLDLVGPVAGLKAANYLELEILPGSNAPLRSHLTGFLAFLAAKPEEKPEEDSGEQIDSFPSKVALRIKPRHQESGPSRQTSFWPSLGSLSFSEPGYRPSTQPHLLLTRAAGGTYRPTRTGD